MSDSACPERLRGRRQAVPKSLISLRLTIRLELPAALPVPPSCLPRAVAAELSRAELHQALGLAPLDFTGLWHEKHAAHLPGTREWAFAEIIAWLDGSESPQLFWMM